MEKKTIGSFIAILRKAKGMTQKELAELLNVSDKAISRWERDESMPDISLIPVLADIFEVTCDELLRGEKTGKESFTETEEKKASRMRILLKRSQNRFFGFCMLPVGISLIGLLMAVFLNFVIKKATLGFYSVLSCLIMAAAAQIAIYFIVKAEIDTEEIESEVLKNYQKTLRDITLKIFYMIIIVLGICLPLLLFGQMDYADYIAAITQAMAPEGFTPDTSTDIGALISLGKVSIGLQAKKWLLYGCISGAAAAVFCLIADSVLRYSDAKHGRFGMTEEDLKIRRKMLFRLGKYVIALIVLILLTAETGRVFQENMPGRLQEGTVFTTYEEFKKHMETKPEDMAPGVVELRQQREKYYKVLYGDEGEVLCEYLLLNDDVVKIEYGEDNKLPITTYTEADYAAAKEKVDDMMWIFPVVMIAECALVSALYSWRRKKAH